MMKKWLFCLVAFILSFPAVAEWHTWVQKDAFDDQQTAMMVGIGTMDFGIALDCSNDSLFAGITKETDKVNIALFGSSKDLIFRIDEFPAVKTTGVLAARNEKMYIYKIEDEQKIKELLSYLRKAQKRVLAGVKEPSEERGASFNVTPTGSTTAVNKFIKACNIKIPE
ncbi:hypothetical protein RCT70_14400 [Escherichia marmotae]|uniref:hypothetical protein n=1 Tax=Escherichia TaxID=561 RepID=UPI0029FC45C6|nr:hypothetical protein [Escherichia coli]MEC9524145.1 hypothetical protein [Escherichia marmotae]